jgi:aryl-alcohol dehydrogenase-like predicted oxidoreductase
MGKVEDAEAIATVQAALEMGVTFIDTAQAYRGSEGLIGRALGGGRREKAFLATKVSGNYSRAHIQEAIENSLRALRTDHVDLYQIHGWNPRFPIEESMATMEELRQAGKARFLGVSNFNVAQMEQARAVAPFVSLQPRYNLLDREIEREIAPHCKRERVGILVHSPLAKGLLTGRYRPGHVFPPDDERAGFARFQGEEFAHISAAVERLRAEVAEPRGITLPQLAIAWTLRLPAVSVCLVGAKSPAQIREHLGALGWQLTADELQRIETILTDLKGSD